MYMEYTRHINGEGETLQEREDEVHGWVTRESEN